MMENETKGDKYMTETKEKLEEVGRTMKELVSKLSPKNAQVTNEMIQPLCDQLGSVIHSAQRGKEHYKNAKQVSDEVVEKMAQPSNKKISKIDFTCERCPFKTEDVEILVQHMERYHRRRPIQVRAKYQQLNKIEKTIK